MFAVINNVSNEIGFSEKVGGFYPPSNGSLYIFRNTDEFNKICERAKRQSFDSLYTDILEQWNLYSYAAPHHPSIHPNHNEICAVDIIYTYFQDVFGITH